MSQPLCLPFYLSLLLFPSSPCNFPPPPRLSPSVCLSMSLPRSVSFYVTLSPVSSSLSFSLTMSCPMPLSYFVPLLSSQSFHISSLSPSLKKKSLSWWSLLCSLSPFFDSPPLSLPLYLAPLSSLFFFAFILYAYCLSLSLGVSSLLFLSLYHSPSYLFY
jgi:hypothetical protein